MNASTASGPGSSSAVRGLAAAGTDWNRFWFTPADARPLAVVRIVAAAVGLALWWSYAADVTAWFAPHGMLPVETVRQWRSPMAFSLYDFATTPATVTMLFSATGLVFLLLLVGLGTALVAPLAAVLWASLLHRGPMLAGPADDCLAVLLWCLAIGPAGWHFSCDAWLRARAGRPAPGPAVRAAVSRGLLQVYGSAITVAAVLAQLKGDAWWDGLAAWYLATGPQSWCGRLVPALEDSEYLTNLLTHAIMAFEVLFAVGIWCGPTQRTVARVAVVAWPLIGLLAGMPLWGAALAAFALPAAADFGPTAGIEPPPGGR
jgi:hypothetical protein